MIEQWCLRTANSLWYVVESFPNRRDTVVFVRIEAEWHLQKSNIHFDWQMGLQKQRHRREPTERETQALENPTQKRANNLMIWSQHLCNDEESSPHRIVLNFVLEMVILAILTLLNIHGWLRRVTANCQTWFCNSPTALNHSNHAVYRKIFCSKCRIDMLYSNDI